MSIESILASFEAGSGNGAFPWVNRSQVALGIRNRLRDPDMIDQGDASLCGPASFLYCVIKDYPETWVTYVTQMYLTGRARIHGLEVKPSRDCLNAKLSGIKAVDWVALASLRDSENTFFDYQDSSNKVGGITMPGTLAGWFERAGYRQVTNETNVFFTKGTDTMRTALGLVGQRRRVCMFVNDTMVNRPTQAGGTFSTANHWVVLTGGDGIHGDKIGLKLWTWGKTKNMVGFDTGKIVSNFYGYVAAAAHRGG